MLLQSLRFHPKIGCFKKITIGCALPHICEHHWGTLHEVPLCTYRGMNYFLRCGCHIGQLLMCLLSHDHDGTVVVTATSVATNAHNLTWHMRLSWHTSAHRRRMHICRSSSAAMSTAGNTAIWRHILHQLALSWCSKTLGCI